jgi:hypothetical protein
MACESMKCSDAVMERKKPTFALPYAPGRQRILIMTKRRQVD